MSSSQLHYTPAQHSAAGAGVSVSNIYQYTPVDSGYSQPPPLPAKRNNANVGENSKATGLTYSTSVLNRRY